MYRCSLSGGRRALRAALTSRSVRASALGTSFSLRHSGWVCLPVTSNGSPSTIPWRQESKHAGSVLDVDIGGFHVWRLRGSRNPRIQM